MKKIFFVCLALMLYIQASQACDACGSGLNLQLGLIPNLQRNYLGIRYQQFHFYSHDEHVSLNETQAHSHEIFRTVEIYGNFSLSRRIQVFASLPYKISSRETAYKTYTIRGIGDAQILIRYKLLETKSKFTQTLFLSSGIKFVTGKYNEVQQGSLLHEYLQCGSGSYDFPFHINYIFKKDKFIFNSDLYYLMKSENKMKYKFGNSMGMNAQCYYQINKQQTVFMPQIGLVYAMNEKDKRNNEIERISGSQQLLGQIGIDFYYKKIGVICNWQPTLLQQHNNGLSKSSGRLQTSFVYTMK
jgi:hypothetical protein